MLIPAKTQGPRPPARTLWDAQVSDEYEVFSGLQWFGSHRQLEELGLEQASGTDRTAGVSPTRLPVPIWEWDLKLLEGRRGSGIARDISYRNAENASNF